MGRLGTGTYQRPDAEIRINLNFHKNPPPVKRGGFYFNLEQPKPTVYVPGNKKKVHGLLHPEIVGDKHWDKIINVCIITLIILNIIAVMLETVPYLHDEPHEKKSFIISTGYPSLFSLSSMF
ncbi:MAG: hypothetical protein FJY20_03560 [Bacteroidetes bacterium]|nr:hypothetical protein [Bacteroidota bacterium]